MTKERPILFNGEMVRAIIDGRKTQHRFPINPQPTANRCVHDLDHSKTVITPFLINSVCARSNIESIYAQFMYKTEIAGKHFSDKETGSSHKCLFGKVGDRLWVREKHALYQSVIHTRKIDGRSFSEIQDGSVWHFENGGLDTIQELKDHIKMMTGLACESVEVKDDRWLPSIHMPRWASRITLEITDIRVEKVQDISGHDAKSEGIDSRLLFKLGLIPESESQSPIMDIQARHGFLHLWNSIYLKKGFGWDKNPWVWVVEFKVVNP